MNCRKCTRRLSAYIDDRIDASERASIDEHLQACPGCARQLRVARASSLALRNESAAMPPTDLAARAARAALTADSPPERQRSFLERWIPIAAPTTALAAAAAVALLVINPAPSANNSGADNGSDPLGLVSDFDDSDELAGDILAMGEE